MVGSRSGGESGGERQEDHAQFLRVEAGTARVTVLLYLLDLALRYVEDGLPVTVPAGDVQRWAYPTVRDALAASPLGGTPR